MLYHFDLLQEPWIPVVDLKGRRLELGLLQTLYRAHELREISDASAMVEYGLYRLLNVFLMDALRPEELEDLEELLNAGRFDRKILDAYIALCHSEGASFDLFDEKRPFLQVPYLEDYDKRKRRSVSKLDIEMPSGNNHVHFEHLAQPLELGYGHAARLLVIRNLISTCGMEGPSSINASPPYFAVFRGRTLFETLIHLLIPVSDIQVFADPPVFWRCDQVVVPKKKVLQTSWLYGMLFPARRIHLIPNGKGVQEMYFGPGMDFCLLDNWTDPHVTYRVGKEGRFPWRPNGTRAVWRNLNDLVDIQGKRAPKIAEVYQMLQDSQDIPAQVMLYGVQTNQASYLDVYRHDLQLPLGLFREGRAKLIGDCITAAETLVRKFQGVLRKKRMDKTGNYVEGITQQMVTETVQMIYQSCEAELWNLCNTILARETVEAQGVYDQWNRKLSEIGASAMQGLLNRLNLKGKQLVALSESLATWDSCLYRLKKGGETHG